MKRNSLIYIKKWFFESNRKPLVLRGARQTGKTWLARTLAKECNLKLIELNFEREPSLFNFFESNDPKKILLLLESHLSESIHPEKSLLFLDEIQAAPEILAKLRWFAEEMPELAVIAAGSLLEFVLSDHAFSMPVGRITYLYLEPLSFEEFLWAIQKEKCVEFLQQYSMKDKIPTSLHQQLLSYFKEYCLIGGLPAAVAAWTSKHSLEAAQLIHHDVLTTYRDDFAKYAKKIPAEYLDAILTAVPQMVGCKFMYRRVNENMPIPTIKKALDLLCKARVCHRVDAVHANGIPIAAEVNDKIFKVILLDSGLVSAALMIPLHQLELTHDINLVHQGALSEHVVGQLLRTAPPFYIAPRLFYWTRMEANAASEVDYVIQHHTELIPIEVKSGSTGSLKSLHYFMAQKKWPLAVRINSDLPSCADIDVKIQTGQSANYRLLSIPIYLTEQLHRLIDAK